MDGLSNRPGIAVNLIMMLFCLVTVRALKAQVTIEERVEISQPDSAGNSWLAKTLTTADSLVVPYDGFLIVRYDSAESAFFQMSLNADLVVTRNDTTFGVDTVISRLGTPILSQYWCSSQDNDTKYVYYPGLEPPASKTGATQSQDSVWAVGVVSAGDKITFDYDGKKTWADYVTGDEPLKSDSSWVGAALRCMSPPPVVVAIWEDAVWFTVIVQRDSLTIEIDEPKEVWPDIIAAHISQSNREFDLGSVEDTISVTATFQIDGSPISDEEILVHAKWIKETGGHFHGTHPDFIENANCRDTGTKDLPLEKMKFKDLAAPGVVRSDTIVGTTDQNGELKLRFYAPRWGGRVVLWAEIDSLSLSDSDTLTVKVPGLNKLPVSSDYVKFGGTGLHPGPDDNCFAGQSSNYSYEPDENHWATPETITKLLAINSKWSSTPGHDKLWINDMSLPFGGHFDERGAWNRPHTFHRVGRDVDVRVWKITKRWDGIEVKHQKDADNNFLYDERGNPVWANTDFDDLASDLGAHPRPKVHNQNHYHLFFY